MIRRLWTQKEEARLREMCAAGRGPTEIGQAIGRTTKGVQRKLLDLGLRTGIKEARQWTPEAEATAVSMAAEGLGPLAISRAVGRTREAVTAKLKALLRRPALVRTYEAPPTTATDDDGHVLALQRLGGFRSLERDRSGPVFLCKPSGGMVRLAA